jgi:peptidoglycan hydrolase CwlO-like protein
MPEISVGEIIKGYYEHTTVADGNFKLLCDFIGQQDQTINQLQEQLRAAQNEIDKLTKKK